MSLRGLFFAGLALTGFAGVACAAESPAHSGVGTPVVGMASKDVDSVVTRAMTAFSVPGVAVGIVKDGHILFAKGYGRRAQDQNGLVDTETLFQIGSTTKAFTAAALAILVDRGKIGWDDKVTDYLPDFQLYDPYVTREFTIRDLLSHRSGLGPGAGDLMFYPATDFSRSEIIRGLRYLKPVSSFRAHYDYDNSLYMVAGEIIPAVSGKSWEDFVTDEIFRPLQMEGCAATFKRIADRSNVASPHGVIQGKLTRIPVEDISVVGAAGTISCNIDGLAKWLTVQLANGRTSDGRQLFSADRSSDMWTVNTVKPVDPIGPFYNTSFAGYAMGWEVTDALGHRRISHTGGVPGSSTWISMLPDLGLGIVVLTNAENGLAMTSIGNQIMDAYLGAPKRDWIDIATTYEKARAADAAAAQEAVRKGAFGAGKPTLPLDAYVGTYRDAWRGDATVRREGSRLVLKFSRTQGLEGGLEHYSGNLFVVRWNNRRLDADAFVRFEQGFGDRIVGMTMRPISPSTDFSFDFQDLDFKKL